MPCIVFVSAQNYHWPTDYVLACAYEHVVVQNIDNININILKVIIKSKVEITKNNMLKIYVVDLYVGSTYIKKTRSFRLKKLFWKSIVMFSVVLHTLFQTQLAQSYQLVSVFWLRARCSKFLWNCWTLLCLSVLLCALCQSSTIG